MKEHKKKIRLTPGKVIWMLLAVFVICCILLSIFETPLGWQADLTPNQIYTLSAETEEMLKKLEDQVTVYTLYSPGNSNKTMTTLLEQYAVACEKVTVSNIDPATDRLSLKEFETQEQQINDGSLVITDEETGRYRVIDAGELYLSYGGETYFVAENAVTSAIHYVTTGEFQRILLMTGHRETDMGSLDSLIGRYKLRNYRIEEYDYLRTAGEPDPETDLLLCTSPKEDFSETEAASIETFVKNGGTFILLYDNAVYNEERGIIEMRENEMPMLGELLRAGGIRIRDGIIAGKNAAETGFRNTTVELDSEKYGQIVFSECTALESLGTSDCQVTELLRTLRDCELRSRENGTVMEEGSFAVGLLSERDKGRMAVFSTSSFVGDTEFAIGDNAGLLDDILNRALPGEPEMILKAKKADTEELFIHSILVKVMITLVVLLMLPGAILIVGITVTRRRREKYQQ